MLPLTSQLSLSGFEEKAFDILQCCQATARKAKIELKLSVLPTAAQKS